jgi:hypothetical protein
LVNDSLDSGLFALKDEFDTPPLGAALAAATNQKKPRDRALKHRQAGSVANPNFVSGSAGGPVTFSGLSSIAHI